MASHQKKDRSKLTGWYGSEFSDYPGFGYPSCNRALARRVRNINDPNGYYAELGLLPWATKEEIKRALRDVYRRYHPDGLTPDSERFMRFQEIGAVLNDQLLKTRYDQTPEGQLFIDSEILSVIAENGIGLDVLAPFDDQELEDKESFYDYYSEGEDPFDMINAQQWYEALIKVAPMVGYTKSIRLFITEEREPVFAPLAGIIQIPRGWEPNSGLAYAIMSCCVVS
jgi:curved DNA-binding protein CbpA